MAMMLIGAGQFVIGASVAAWGVGQLDPAFCVNSAASRLDKACTWTLTLAAYAIALASPLTVLMGSTP